MSTPLRTASLLRVFLCAIGVIARAEIAGSCAEEYSALTNTLSAALKQIQEQRRQQPENMMLRLREAQHLSWLGRLRSAEAAYEDILERVPNDHDALSGHGLVLYWQGDWQGAAAAFDKVLQKNPEHRLAFNSYLRVLVASGDVTNAYRLANERDSGSGGTDAELGLILATICKDHDLAKGLASRATTDLDLRGQQVVFQARQSLALGHHRSALELAKTFAEAHPESYQAQVNAGDIFTGAGETDAARRFYQAARNMDPERLEARLGLARLARREGQPHLSLKLHQDIVSENPEALEAWLGVIQTTRMLGQIDRASEALNQAEQLAPKSAILHEERLHLARARHSANAERHSRADLTVSAGYEYSAIQNDAESPDWHEAFVSVAWRGLPRNLLQVDYRRYERFGSSADQLGFALVHGWTKDWLARLEGGVAFSGDFIPEWRAGIGATYRFGDRLHTQLHGNYLRFIDANVWQFVPGLTWRWAPQLSSEARLYISHTELESGSSDQSLAYYLNTAWEFRPQSLLRLHYSIGEENSADLTRNLIGEGHFQSIGTDVRFGWEKWVVQPGYRYEWHDRFSLHALGLSIHYRF